MTDRLATIEAWYGTLARAEIRAWAEVDILWSEPSPTRGHWQLVERRLAEVDAARRELGFLNIDESSPMAAAGVRSPQGDG